MKQLDAKHRLSIRAKDYFGGDVQHFDIYRESRGVYAVTQETHWHGQKVAARVYAENARDAVKELNRMARNDHNQFA